MGYASSLFRVLLVALLPATTIAAASGDSAPRIEAERLSQSVKVLASDEFEGRAPGGAGEARTVAWLEKQLSALGLEPGGENGGWTQAVPLLHTRLQAPAKLSMSVAGATQPLMQGADIALNTVQPLEQIKIEAAPVVFVGFGVPEIPGMSIWMDPHSLKMLQFPYSMSSLTGQMPYLGPGYEGEWWSIEFGPWLVPTVGIFFAHISSFRFACC